MDKAPRGSTDSRRKPAPESSTLGAAVAQAVRATAPDARRVLLMFWRGKVERGVA